MHTWKEVRALHLNSLFFLLSRFHAVFLLLFNWLMLSYAKYLTYLIWLRVIVIRSALLWYLFICSRHAYFKILFSFFAFIFALNISKTYTFILLLIDRMQQIWCNLKQRGVMQNANPLIQIYFSFISRSFRNEYMNATPRMWPKSTRWGIKAP